MAGIPFGFAISKDKKMLSLEHTHPPASFVVHGQRFLVQKEIKRKWFSVLKKAKNERKNKEYYKKNIPARFIELLFSKKVSITKIPNRKAVISDLFINRLENNWETYFEFLKTKHVLSPEIKNVSDNEAIIYFFTSKGKFIISRGKKF